MSNNISPATQSLIQRYQIWQKAQEPPQQGVSTIHVDEVAAKVAGFYEKIRGVIDWREEHLLRRGGIERILKRRSKMRQKSWAFWSKAVRRDIIFLLLRL